MANRVAAGADAGQPRPFKNINDSLGHELANEVLCELGARLRGLARDIGAHIARPSGDEFVILDRHAAIAGRTPSPAPSRSRALSEPFVVDGDIGVRHLEHRLARSSPRTAPSHRGVPAAGRHRHLPGEGRTAATASRSSTSRCDERRPAHGHGERPLRGGRPPRAAAVPPADRRHRDRPDQRVRGADAMAAATTAPSSPPPSSSPSPKTPG